MFVVNAAMVEVEFFSFLSANNRLFCIAQNRNVWVMSGKYKLCQLLSVQQLADEVAVECLIIQIVFRLIDEDYWIALQVHQNMENYRGTLSERVISQGLVAVTLILLEENHRFIGCPKAQEVCQML